MKTIKFYRAGIGPDPVPAKTVIPQWYKDISLYNASNNFSDVSLDNENGIDSSAISLKLCSPTFDAFSSGYQVLLAEDILVELDSNGVPEISWASKEFTINRMPSVEFAIPPFYHPIAFAFRMMQGFSTPPGTSCLVSHPFNRLDLPFYVTTAIVDSDKKFPPADIRFVLRRDFEGVIKEGTPIYQILPFTREEWKIELDNELRDEAYWEHENRRTYVHSWYTKQLQSTKEYN